MTNTRERVVSILGSTSVGKSALTLMFIKDEFVENYDPTIAKSYTKENFKLNNNLVYSLRVNDTAGLEEHSQIQSMYTNSDGFILVYSITDPQSFYIVETIYQKLCDELNGAKPVVLVGNKSDLEHQRRVSTEKGKTLAESWKATFLEMSAKDGKAVANVFQSLLREIDPMPRSVGNTNNSTNANGRINQVNSSGSGSNTNNNNDARGRADGSKQTNQQQQQQQQKNCTIS